MKVLLLQDVYKLGRAGEVKKVANGYGRNYLIPQGLAVLATPAAMKMAERIKAEAEKRRAELNKELSAVAERLDGLTLAFPARAGETGKLYGSITTQMIADALSEKAGVEITKRQIDAQPLRHLGEHTVHVRLTIDLVPEVKVIVYREGEPSPLEVAAREAEATAEAEAEAETEAEASAETAEASEAEAEA